MKEQPILEIDLDKELANAMVQLNSFQKRLAAPSMMKDALNSTASKVRARTKKDLLNRYAITEETPLKDANKGAPKVGRATESNLVATIHSKGPMLGLTSLTTQEHDRDKKTAVKAKVLNSSSLKELGKDGIKPFITKFRSGHTAVVQRAGKKRLPLRKLCAPAIPIMLSQPEVRQNAEEKAYEMLQRSMKTHMEKMMREGG